MAFLDTLGLGCLKILHIDFIGITSLGTLRAAGVIRQYSFNRQNSLIKYFLLRGFWCSIFSMV
jgi:hypothetical protein